MTTAIKSKSLTYMRHDDWVFGDLHTWLTYFRYVNCWLQRSCIVDTTQTCVFFFLFLINLTDSASLSRTFLYARAYGCLSRISVELFPRPIFSQRNSGPRGGELMGRLASWDTLHLLHTYFCQVYTMHRGRTDLNSQSLVLMKLESSSVWWTGPAIVLRTNLSLVLQRRHTRQHGPAAPAESCQ